MRFEDYYELSEKTGWRTTDLDWDALRRDQDAGLVGDFERKALLGTAVIEYGVPHYGEVWTLVEKLREHWELWQFTSLWTGEEHRHSYVLKKTSDALGFTKEIEEDLEKVTKFPFAQTQKKSCPDDCYRTVPGMLTYTVIQELATHKFYAMASKRSRSPFLKRLFQLIAGDEMRHHVFYRDAMRDLHESAEDKEWYIDQIYRAGRSFNMPHLVYDLQMDWFERGDWSIGTLGKIAFKTQLLRCISFSPRLIARIMTENTAAEVDKAGGRAPTPRLTA